MNRLNILNRSNKLASFSGSRIKIRLVSSGDIIYRRRKQGGVLYIDYSDDGGLTWELNIYSALLSEDVIAVTIDSSPVGYQEVIRDGAYKIDFDLGGGFAGTEDVDWENTWSTAPEWSQYKARVEADGGTVENIISVKNLFDFLEL